MQYQSSNTRSHTFPCDFTKVSKDLRIEFFTQLEDALSKFLERRFQIQHLTTQELLSEGSGNSSLMAAHVMVFDAGTDNPGLKIVNLNAPAESQILLQVRLHEDKGFLRHSTNFEMTRSSDELLAVIAERFLTTVLSQGEINKDQIHNSTFLQDGDVLFNATDLIDAWLPHPQGILVKYREKGIYLNELPIKIDNYEQLEPTSDGVLYSKNKGIGQVQIYKHDFLGLDTLIYEGRAINWTGHPDGVAIQTVNRITLNGKAILYQGDRAYNPWAITASGEVLTTQLKETSQGNYVQMFVGDQHFIFEFMLECPDINSKQMLQVGTWKQFCGVVVVQANRSPSIPGPIYLVDPSISGTGLVQIWSPNKILDPDYYAPSLEGGRTDGIVERLDRAFIYRSSQRV